MTDVTASPPASRLPDWPTANPPPTATGRLKVRPEDFVVDELLDLELTGSGEFLWLRVAKRAINTADVAKLLAKDAGLPARAVSYSGLKDRQAAAAQWFSLHLPGLPDPDLPDELCPGVEILDRVRHQKKLRSGTHRANRFQILLRDCHLELDDLSRRCEQVSREGVPNYFGAQRFGRNGDNLRQVQGWYAARQSGQRSRRRGRHLEGLLHSTARAFLFNEVLAERVRDGDWAKGRDGDIWMLAGTRSIFGPESMTDELRARCVAGDVAPTGPLYGRAGGTLWPVWEQALLERHPELTGGLDAAGARPARRRLSVRPHNFQWAVDGDQFTLSFELARGEFATVVLRELIDVDAQSVR
ncbi:MAG: tRNA pseudouridine(13) synthase TruD [Pseudomonadota bacterium]